MSDLSRLRARWLRLEKRIATLEASVVELDEDADEHEIAEITEKIVIAKARLALTVAQTETEERRLFDVNAMLRFTNI